MPIERKDRSFDRIFNEVEIKSVPPKYINEVKITLRDGSTILLSSMEEASEVTNALDIEEIADISISLDYENVKKDVTKEINDILKQHFKEGDDSE
jgi:hypothetical protein